MGLMNTIKSLFSSTGSASRKSNRSYVLDGARLVDEKGGRRLSPREQVQVLHALSRVVKQEGLDIRALFVSDRPLREADHGGVYQGVTVYYAPSAEELGSLALKLCKETNGALVSSDAEVENRAREAGITVLNSGTFRKAFLAGGIPSADRGNGGGRDRRRERRRERGPESNAGNPPRLASDESSPTSESSDTPASESGEGTSPAPDDRAAVRHLIDLVE